MIFASSSFTALLKVGLFPGKFLSWNAYCNDGKLQASLICFSALELCSQMSGKQGFSKIKISWVSRLVDPRSLCPWDLVLGSLNTNQCAAHNYTHIKNKGALQLQTCIVLLPLLWR